jgi:hypothetical protein
MPAAIRRVNNSSSNNNNKIVLLKRSLVEATAEVNFLMHPLSGVKLSRLSMILTG